jgi:hypothetical protein
MIWEEIGAFVWRHWRLFAGAAVAGVLILLLMIARGDARHYKALWQQEQAAHQLTIANYKAAAAEAERMDQANIVRVQTEQQAITEKVTNDYQSKLADSTDRYERLRAKASGYLSHPASPGVPETRDTTCLAVAGTSCEGIPPLLLEAQRNTDQLIALQDWVKAQSKVDVGNAP